MKKKCIALCIASLLYMNGAFASDAGMPQLNPEYWGSQVFWLIIIFSILYLIIWKIFLPKITYSIENRKSRIVNNLDEAQKLKESAEEKLKENNKIIEKSKNEAKKIIDDERKKLDQDIEKKSPLALDVPGTPGNPKKLVLDDMVSMYEHSVQGKLF